MVCIDGVGGVLIECGEEDNEWLEPGRQGPHYLDAVHQWHLDVEKDQVRLALEDDL